MKEKEKSEKGGLKFNSENKDHEIFQYMQEK